MSPEKIQLLVTQAIAGKELLQHPFYQRWNEGGVTMAELASYAEQYRHIEAALPSVLGAVVASLPAGRAHDAAAANLADELGNPAPHAEIFESFATAVGACEGVAPGAAVTALLDAQNDAVAHSPQAALAALSAYECQAGAIAASKSAGLSSHYGLDAKATAFWDLHASLEDDHAGWSFEALSELGADPEVVQGAAKAAAGAWWAFLDEREAEAA